MPIFLKDVESDSIDVSKYGKILRSGWGENPSEEIVNEIKAKYS